MKKKVAVVKVQSPHDIRWNLPGYVSRAFGFLGKRFDVLNDINGNPFMPQLTPYYLAALGMQADTTGQYSFEVIDTEPGKINLSGYDMAWITCSTTTAPLV